eukprot:jgi/Bigna1/125546/aug1.1_g254
MSEGGIAQVLTSIDAGLERYAAALKEFGAEKPKDLQFLREDDGKALRIPPLQMRKILKGIERLGLDEHVVGSINNTNQKIPRPAAVSTPTSDGPYPSGHSPFSPSSPSDDGGNNGGDKDQKHMSKEETNSPMDVFADYYVNEEDEEDSKWIEQALETDASEDPMIASFDVTTRMESSVQSIIKGWKDGSAFFDEMYDAKGTAYGAIEKIVSEIESKSPRRIEEFKDKSLKDFASDNRLYHIPRMLTRKEAERLHKGVHQRARTIQAFLRDHYSAKSKKPTYRNKKIFPKAILKNIIARNEEKKLLKSSGRTAMQDTWGFWYGPDIIRAPSGEFYVCEDNLGYVGGMGDLEIARKSILSSFPEYSPHITSDTQEMPGAFYDALVDDYRGAVRHGEAVVLLCYPRWMWPDKEEKRVIRLFESRGLTKVEIPIPGFRSKDAISLKILLRLPINMIEKNGVYLVKKKKQRKSGRLSQKSGKSPRRRQSKRNGSESPSKKGKRTRVGLIVIDAEIYDVDPANSTVRMKSILEEAKYWQESHETRARCLRKAYAEKLKQGKQAKKLGRKVESEERNAAQLQRLIEAYTNSRKKHRLEKIRRYLRSTRKDDLKDMLRQGFPGILDAYFNGLVKIVNGPGFDFLGDKQFCCYMDTLTRFYLNEEPILKTIPTLSFSLKEPKRSELLRAVFDDPDSQHALVVKRVDGRGGDAVWVGPKLSRDEFVKVKPMVEKEPAAFLVQKYIALSQVDGQLTDLRNLASVRRNSIVVSKTLWARGVPSKNSNGKVNISDQGFEFAVFTER